MHIHGFNMNSTNPIFFFIFVLIFFFDIINKVVFTLFLKVNKFAIK